MAAVEWRCLSRVVCACYSYSCSCSFAFWEQTQHAQASMKMRLSNSGRDAMEAEDRPTALDTPGKFARRRTFSKHERNRADKYSLGERFLPCVRRDAPLGIEASHGRLCLLECNRRVCARRLNRAKPIR